MKKIPSLFKRNYDGNRKVYDAITPGVEWVLTIGIPTRKYDGQAVLLRGRNIYIRYDAKTGRVPPDGFIPCQSVPDPNTGHWPGWVKPTKGQDKYILEAIKNYGDVYPADGTYEVCGPKIGTRHGANPEELTRHLLFRHGNDVIQDCPTNFNDLREFLRDLNIEGIVWINPTTGEMAKIKVSDFDYS